MVLDGAPTYSECATECVQSATTANKRFQLAYMQFDNAALSCQCFTVDSPRLPSDADATEWIFEHAVRDTAPSTTDLYMVAASYHQYIYLEQFSVTVYFESAFPEGTIVTTRTPDATNFQVSASECARSCTGLLSTNLRAFSYQVASTKCSCFAVPILDSSYDALLRAASGLEESSTTIYMASVCSNTQPDTLQSSFVWDKQTASWCPGRVSEDGMDLSAINGTVYNAADSDDYGVKCGATCAGDCRFAELMVTPWDELAGALPINPPPPPSPPSPPPTPPPPLNPFPPGVPEGASNVWRTWFPRGSEFPTDSDGDGEFEITCGVPSCGRSFSVFEGSVDAVTVLARQLELDNTFQETLCPWECKPTVFSHELSPAERRGLLSGSGFGGFVLPGSEAGGMGFSTFEKTPVSGAVELEANHVDHNASRSDCISLMQTRSAVGAVLGVWIRESEDALYPGECLLFHATRSKQQYTLWNSFALYAQSVTNAPHYTTLRANAYSARVPDDTEPCQTSSDHCIFWNEFDSLAAGTAANSYFCKPDNDLTNVLTPVKLMDMIGTTGVHFPPPSPPLPGMPNPPFPPPPPPMVCSATNIPTMANQFTFPLAGGWIPEDVYHGSEAYDWKNPTHFCWKWNWDNFMQPTWPPEYMHANQYFRDDVACGNTQATLKLDISKIRMYNTESMDLTNEILSPTGAYYPDCTVAADNECCIARHQFRTCQSAAVCGEDEVYTNRRATGCKDRCAAERRYGDDQSCLPAHPSCVTDATEYNPATWSTPRFMETACMCGAKLAAMDSTVIANIRIPPPSPPHSPPASSTSPPPPRVYLVGGAPPPPGYGRRLSGVDAGVYNLMNASQQCRLDVLDFKMQYMPSTTSDGSAVCDYLNTQKPDSAAGLPDCGAAGDHECCVTDRHAQHMSRTYINDGSGSFTSAGSSTHEVGTDIFDEDNNRNIISDDFNNDGKTDILVGNNLYISDGSGSFANVDPVRIGISNFKKAYSVNFDDQSYVDIGYIDEAGKAYVMRSSNKYQPTSASDSSTVQFSGEYIMESTGTNERLIRFACLVSPQSGDFYDNECESIYEGMPIKIVAAQTASTNCNNEYLMSLTTLQVRFFAKYECNFDHNGQHQHRCYTFYVPMPDPDISTPDIICEGTTGTYSDRSTWKTFTIEAERAPQPGQVPTFFYPQRVGDVGDTGVIDIAFTHAKDTVRPTLVDDYVLDACLLFKGRPMKCFVFSNTQVSRYDSGTALRIIYPAREETFEDATGFATIRGINKDTIITCDGAGSELSSRYITCESTQPHGINPDTDLEIEVLNGWQSPQCTATTNALEGAWNTVDNCDFRYGGPADLVRNVVMRSSIMYFDNYFSFMLPFRWDASTNNVARNIQVKVRSNPRLGTSGYVNTGRSLDWSQRMIVMRENNPPVVVYSRAQQNPQFYGNTALSKSNAAYAIGGFYGSGGGEQTKSYPLLAMAMQDQQNKIFYTPYGEVDTVDIQDRVPVAFGTEDSSTRALAWCNFQSPRPGDAGVSRQVDLVTVGEGEETRVYTMQDNPTNPFTSSAEVHPRSVILTYTPPRTVAVACGDFNGDGHEDIVTHVVVKGGGSCAYRCHEVGRFGFETNYIGPSAAQVNNTRLCYCGPRLSLATGPSPPPLPPPVPRLPPPPPFPPPPGLPPSPSSPPPPPPKHRPGLCVHFKTASFQSPYPPPPPTSINGSPVPPAPPPPPPSPETPPPPSPPPPAPPPAPPRPPPNPPPPSLPPSFPSPPGSPPPAPMFPPIEDTLSSRLIYFSLSEENGRILAEHAATGWQAISIAVLDSEQGYPDSALIEVSRAQQCMPPCNLFSKKLDILTIVSCFVFAGHLDARS
jgi:hypothetical protein